MISLATLVGRRPLRFGVDNINIVGDGNSIMVGFPSTSSYSPVRVACNTAPISGLVTPAVVANSGSRWSQLKDDHTDVDAAWVNGAVNILVVVEGTNTIIGGYADGAGCITQMRTYLDAVWSVHPWRVVMMTTLPANRTGSVNAEIDIYNSLLLANYRSYGIEAVCDTRPAGGPYALTGYTNSDFLAVSTYWASSENDSNAQVHPSNLGYTYLGQRLAATLAAMRKVPR